MGFLLLVPDFLLIVGGALLRRHARFPTEFWAGVERLVYYVLFPALLFRALATAPLPASGTATFLAVGVGFTLGGMLLSALGRPLLRLDSQTFAACFQCGFRFNTYIVLALPDRLDAARRASRSLPRCSACWCRLVNVAAVTVLAQGRGARVALEIARNPLVHGHRRRAGWSVRRAAAAGDALARARASGERRAAARAARGRCRPDASAPRAAAGAGVVYRVKLLAMPAIALALARARWRCRRRRTRWR